ncbi:MAG: CHAP domain-containing protein [Candidatus Choladocola sp.]|nr:CHAP domain-containing protein [Candidatus Choladocola sp.]
MKCKKSLIFAVLMIFMLSFVPVSARVGTNDYPYSSEGVDPWNFYKLNCTSFAAWRLNNDCGIPFTNQYRGVTWGDAKNWGNAAASVGIPVDKNPQPGDVAVWTTGGQGHGHVAFVTNVSGSNVTVEEYNWNVYHGYGQRTVSVSKPSCYIHFRYLKLNKNEVTLYGKKGTTISATSSGNSSVVTWKSSRPELIQVKDGVLTVKKALPEGAMDAKVTITASANGLTEKCVVTLKPGQLTFSSKTKTAVAGTSVHMNSALTKKGITDEVSYSSSNTSVATISAAGVLKPKSSGKTKITAKANGYKTVCTVTVKPSVKLSASSKTIKKGGKFTLKATVKGIKKKVYWTTSNKKVAVVSSGGTVTAKGTGKATITAYIKTSEGTYRATCRITVKLTTADLEALVQKAVRKKYGSKYKAMQFSYANSGMLNFTVRYQGGSSANVYVTMGQINPKTGKVTFW